MRWWLALAFSGIAALTAIVVAQLFYARSEAAITDRISELAAGEAVSAATTIGEENTLGGVRSAAADFSRRRRSAVFVLDTNGKLLTPDSSAGTQFARLPNREELLAAALSGRRLVQQLDNGRRVTVALPVRDSSPAASLVTVVARPELQQTIGIVRGEIVRAALWATAAGAVAGLAVALLITRRIRRIASAATEIEQGHFGVTLNPRYHDEIGGLASTVDRMGARLAASFARLELDRDRLERLLEQLHEGVVAVDRHLRVEFANSRARAIMGAPLVSGGSLPDPWPSASMHELVNELFVPGAPPLNVRVHPDEARTFVIAGLPPPLDGTSAVLVLTDATERDRRERAEREFVSNAAHELRTPLTAISSAVDVLQSGAKHDPAQLDRFLDLVGRQTSRLGGLVHALLTLARAETHAELVRLEPVPVEALVGEVLRDSEPHDSPIAIGVDPGVVVLAHRDLLRQALTNLVANALKHGEGAGVGLVAYRAGPSRIVLEVSDHGRGMTRKEAERAFDRFYRARSTPGGYGLGLAIVGAAVSAMSGELAVETAPGAGTTISIALRSADAEDAP